MYFHTPAISVKDKLIGGVIGDVNDTYINRTLLFNPRILLEISKFRYYLIPRDGSFFANSTRRLWDKYFQALHPQEFNLLI